MLSRETPAQLVSILLAVGAIIGYVLVFGTDASPVHEAVLLAIVYVLAMGGAHLYFAVRGVDGEVPVIARWRYLGFVVFYVGSVILLTEIDMGERVGDVSVLAEWVRRVPVVGSTVTDLAISGIIGGLVLVAFVVYFLYEARSGYRDFDG